MRPGGTSVVGTLAVAFVLLIAMACDPSKAESSPVAIAIPPDAAPAETVLRTYLSALLVRDCDTARQLTTPTFRKGNGELCGFVRVTRARIDGAPATPSAKETVFGTTLTTDGDGGQSIEAGELMWFYDLIRQPTGAWRIAGGGSGP